MRVAFISHEFRGFWGTQKKSLALREIHFSCRPVRTSTCQKKVTNPDNFSDSDVAGVWRRHDDDYGGGDDALVVPSDENKIASHVLLQASSKNDNIFLLILLVQKLS